MKLSRMGSFGRVKLQTLGYWDMLARREWEHHGVRQEAQSSTKLSNSLVPGGQLSPASCLELERVGM